MHMGEPIRQDAIATKGKNDARRTEDVARDITERGNGRADEQQHSAEVSEKTRGRFGQRRVGVVAELGAQRSLRDELDRGCKARSLGQARVKIARGTVRAGFALRRSA